MVGTIVTIAEVLACCQDNPKGFCRLKSLTLKKNWSLFYTLVLDFLTEKKYFAGVWCEIEHPPYV